MRAVLGFRLPADLEAGEPPEARGLTRDAVRLLVAYRGEARLVHSVFSLLPSFLQPGDLVVVNTSGTLPAALDAVVADGTELVVHLSNDLGAGWWVVELRRRSGSGTERWLDAPPPGPLRLGPEGARLELGPAYRGSERLWLARLHVPGALRAWLTRHGRPIRYGYVPAPWPVSYYQNVFVTEPGSAEMPSAGRPFTAELITRLVAKGVGVTPVILHTGVASLESGEPPYPERCRVPAVTARRVEAARTAGGRVVAVGTTAVRALESAVDPAGGGLRAFDGWADLVVTPDRGVRVVDGLLTGFHEPEASHLMLLEAVAGRELLEASYRAALEHAYLWHEFGDVHLILP